MNAAFSRLAARYLPGMTTYDDVWFPEPDAWGLDRLAWEEEEEDDPPIDPDELSETREDRRF